MIHYTIHKTVNRVYYLNTYIFFKLVNVKNFILFNEGIRCYNQFIHLYVHSQSLVFMVVMFYKVTVKAELLNAKPLLLG